MSKTNLNSEQERGGTRVVQLTAEQELAEQLAAERELAELITPDAEEDEIMDAGSAAVELFVAYIHRFGARGGAGEAMARLLVGLVSDSYPLPLGCLARLDRPNKKAALAVIRLGIRSPWVIQDALHNSFGDWLVLVEQLPKANSRS